VEKIITHEFKTSRSLADDVLKDLIEEGELVYTYRDPCSYVEFPCNGCQGGAPGGSLDLRCRSES
jgi:hypothetical protein